jgi:hypothetical protein
MHHPSVTTREKKTFLGMSGSPNRFSARGAVSEIRIQGHAAGGAYAFVPSGWLEPRLPRFAEQAPAASAFDQRVSLFHTKERHKEKGKIMIHPLQVRLMEATGGTPPRLTFKLHGFWLNPCDDKKHFSDTVENSLFRIQEPVGQVKAFVT